MKKYSSFRAAAVVLCFVAGIAITSCGGRTADTPVQAGRLEAYLQSDNEYVAAMFYAENASSSGIQPALTPKELKILDGLAERVSPEVRGDFDRKYMAWLNCWTPLDSVPAHTDDARQLLKCNGREFKELIEFCRQQNEDIFLLLYQLAARAQCPYDRLLLHPAHDLLSDFPQFSAYWRDADLSLQKEKPRVEDRICNEPTIWYTRKLLETHYKRTFPGGLAITFTTF